jgi:hypothetical protein
MTLTKALREFASVIPTRDPKAVMPRRDIVRMLDDHHVSRQSWGTGTARTLDDLFEYHENERLYFRNGNNGDNGNGHGNGNGSSAGLIIDVHSVVVLVYHRFRRKWLELFEDRQVFKNGDVLRRSNFNGIAETMRRTGTRRREAMRCLKEELGFGDPSKYELSDHCRTEDRELCPSEKWPGLSAVYHRHIFECVISRTLFRPGGYVEIEKKDGRKIYFEWRPRAQLQLSI